MTNKSNNSFQRPTGIFEDFDYNEERVARISYNIFNEYNALINTKYAMLPDRVEYSNYIGRRALFMCCNYQTDNESDENYFEYRRLEGFQRKFRYLKDSQKRTKIDEYLAKLSDCNNKEQLREKILYLSNNKLLQSREIDYDKDKCIITNISFLIKVAISFNPMSYVWTVGKYEKHFTNNTKFINTTSKIDFSNKPSITNQTTMINNQIPNYQIINFQTELNYYNQ